MELLFLFLLFFLFNHFFEWNGRWLILRNFIATDKFRGVWTHENKHHPGISKFLNVDLKWSPINWSNQHQLNKKYRVNYKYCKNIGSKNKAKWNTVILKQIFYNLSAIYLFVISFSRVIYLLFICSIFYLLITLKVLNFAGT